MNRRNHSYKNKVQDQFEGSEYHYEYTRRITLYHFVNGVKIGETETGWSKITLLKSAV